ncbi:hypothetical protein GJ744_002503 [Endocarpon pusillum]|uniref:Uncharacterized protein n=1 Tax=Endocarpon pusillum TaxID=364733 RepID=A0A8H7AAA3_9EURO|nr:hypothetical protein GJ744_002503 [Endocarpon pusillum]
MNHHDFMPRPTMDYHYNNPTPSDLDRIIPTSLPTCLLHSLSTVQLQEHPISTEPGRECLSPLVLA